MRSLKIRKINNPIHNFKLPEVQLTNSSIWTSSPGNAEIMEVVKKHNTLELLIEVSGLLYDNFEVKVVGNHLNITVEHKKEYVINNISSCRWSNGTTEITKYSVFERSELYLPGNSGQFIQTVKYQKNGRLLVVLRVIK